jgi:hypothetical protein
VLPACDLQAVMPERLQLPADLCQAHVLQRRAELCSQVCTRSGSRVVCRTVCSGPGSRSGNVCCSVCSGSGVLRRAVRSEVRSGPGSDVRRSRGLRSGSGDVRRSVCSGSCVVRRSGLVRRSGSGQVLRYRLPETVLR